MVFVQDFVTNLYPTKWRVKVVEIKCCLRWQKGEIAIDNGSKFKFNALMLIIVSPAALALSKFCYQACTCKFYSIITCPIGKWSFLVLVQITEELYR